MKKLIWILVVAAFGSVGAFLWFRGGSSSGGGEPKYGKIERGDIVETISAMGKLAPKDPAIVGTDISSKVETVYPEAVLGGKVAKDQPWLELDKTVARADLAAAEADLERAKAAKVSAEAGKQAAETEQTLAKLVLENIAKNPGEVSPSFKDESEKMAAKATAQVKSFEARIREAEATIKAAAATVEKAQVGLERTTVKSPIDGTIIQKNVVKGQPVSPQGTPVLFIVIPNLGQLQVKALVGESDIERVREEMTATFTVDALSDQDATFTAKVSAIAIMPAEQPAGGGLGSLGGLAASLPGPVFFPVTLDVLSSADRPLPHLRPGLSANVEFIVGEVKEILHVPNQALTYRPDDLTAAEEKEIEEKVDAGYKPIWADSGTHTMFFIQTGVTDGARTQILQTDETLTEGMRVITEGPEKKQGIFNRPLRTGL